MPHTYEDIETVARGLGVERIVVVLPQASALSARNARRGVT